MSRSELRGPNLQTANPLRILIAVGTLEVGGAERQILEICRRLAGRGFEFHVVSKFDRGPLAEPLRQAGAILHPLSTRFSAPNPSLLVRARNFARSVWRLRRLLSRIRPTVVHAYLFETSVISAAARWPRRRPPLVISKRSLVKWIARYPVYFPLARWTNRRVDRILANSDAVRRDAIQKEGVAAGKIEVIHNGVDTERFRPSRADPELAASLGLPRGRLVVGMIANLHRYKGHAEVLAAAAVLAKERKEFTLLFVGRDGNASEEVRRLVSELRLGHRIVFAGERADPERILNLFDAFVSASHEEGFSNSILEAMACGRPIVATSVGGSVEQIENEVGGLLVPPRDPEALARALGRLLQDDGLRERLGRAARERAVSHFSLDRLCDRMANLYREVAAKR